MEFLTRLFAIGIWFWDTVAMDNQPTQSQQPIQEPTEHIVRQSSGVPKMMLVIFAFVVVVLVAGAYILGKQSK